MPCSKVSSGAVGTVSAVENVGGIEVTYVLRFVDAYVNIEDSKGGPVPSLLRSPSPPAGPASPCGRGVSTDNSETNTKCHALIFPVRYRSFRAKDEAPNLRAVFLDPALRVRENRSEAPTI